MWPISERQLQDLGFIPVLRLSARLPIFFSIVSRLRNSFGLVSAKTFVVLVARFAQGAWLTVFLIPGLLLIMGAVRRHYHRVAQLSAL